MSAAGCAACAAIAASLALSPIVNAAATDDFSARLDKLWDFDAPSVSEARFRTALAQYRSRSRETEETSCPGSPQRNEESPGVVRNRLVW